MKATGWVLSISQSGAAEIQLGKCPKLCGGRIDPASTQLLEIAVQSLKVIPHAC